MLNNNPARRAFVFSQYINLFYLNKQIHRDILKMKFSDKKTFVSFHILS